MTREVALEKLRKYCVYQDRCHQEVRSKLISLQVFGDDQEEIIVELIKDGFLNEERFAQSYARGKFSFKKWGRNKIKMELQRRNISEFCIAKGMAEIDESAYRDTLAEILRKHIEKKKNLGQVLAVDQAIKYASSRGFEAPVIFEVIEALKLS
jgi:regulatory protein